MGQGEITHSGEQSLPEESEVRDGRFTGTSPLFSAASLPLSKPNASPFQDMPLPPVHGPRFRATPRTVTLGIWSQIAVRLLGVVAAYFEVVASQGASLGLPPCRLLPYEGFCCSGHSGGERQQAGRGGGSDFHAALLDGTPVLGVTSAPASRRTASKPSPGGSVCAAVPTRA